jgi:hypothetical protein
MSVVRLTVVGNQMEAEVVCGMLRADGIACEYRRTDFAQAFGGGLSMGGPIEVLVEEHQLAEAEKLLPRDG